MMGLQFSLSEFAPLYHFFNPCRWISLGFAVVGAGCRVVACSVCHHPTSSFFHGDSEGTVDVPYHIVKLSQRDIDGLPEILMLEITNDISIDESEIQFGFIRSSGPGGQNVNKVASAVQLRFDAKRSASLPEDVRQRLLRLAGKRITEDGILIIEAKRYRSQERNRKDAIERLVGLVRKSAEKPKSRKKTKPTEASKRRRLEEKRHRSEIKRLRRSAPPPDE
jgi:ribosome-associated protein